MTEWQLFEPDTVPEFTTAAWYDGRDRAPHLEQSGHRARLLAASGYVVRLVATYGLTSLVDLGAGDGGLLSLVRDIPGLDASWGYDLQQSNVAPAVAARGVDVRYGDVVTGDVQWAEIAVCTEMLEHLIDPHAFLRRLSGHSLAIVASSPVDENRHSHYEFHTWAWDMAGYRALIEQAGFVVERHEVVDAFQLILGVAR